MTRDHKCLSQLTIERYVLGEIKGEALAPVESALAECEECARRLAEIRLDEQAFRLEPVPPKLRAAWNDASKPVLMRWPILGLAGAAVAVALMIAVFRLAPGGPEEGHPAFDPSARSSRTRIKGDTKLEGLELRLGISRVTEQGLVEATDGEKFREGDRIRFWYDLAEPQDAVIVGIDGRRQVTRYFPAPSQGVRKLPAGEGRLAPGLVELDDAKGDERLYLCVGEEAARPEEVMGAAAAIAVSAGSLSDMDRLPLSCDQASVWIVKE